MPRAPITLNDDQCREVETLAALLNQDQIADYFGIARNTFRAICERDEDVGARYKRGKAKAIAHVANGLLQKARSGDTTSSIFYLKTQAGWRETATLEHSGPEGGPIALSSARERLLDHLDIIAGRIGGPVEVPANHTDEAARPGHRDGETRGAGPRGVGQISGGLEPGPARAAKLSHGHDSDRGSDELN